ncbi:MAG: hypothetical protein ACI8TX_002570 [Hyphomicrobiaceae bacterium]|jgi:hypothetical protein
MRENDLDRCGWLRGEAEQFALLSPGQRQMTDAFETRHRPVSWLLTGDDRLDDIRGEEG